MSNKKYVRIIYNEKNDSFDLEISTDGGKTWHLNLSCKCVRSATCSRSDDPEFVHFSVITCFNMCINIGYKCWPYGLNNTED